MALFDKTGGQYSRNKQCELLGINKSTLYYEPALVSRRLSNTLESDFCVEALEESLALYGMPEIFNSDQGSQFTSESFTSRLIAKNVKISIDGRGRAYDTAKSA